LDAAGIGDAFGDKTELIRKKGPWRRLDDVEFGTLEWVDWWNNRQLLGPPRAWVIDFRHPLGRGRRAPLGAEFG